MGQERILNAYEKIDNTLCLNNNRGNLKFGVFDKEDPIVDCANAYEMTDALEVVKAFLEKGFCVGKDKLEALEALRHINGSLIYNKKNMEFGIDTKYHEDCNDAEEMTDCMNILLEAISNTEMVTPYIALQILYNNARIEAGWQEKRCITYAEEMDHNDYVKAYYDVINDFINKKKEEENHLDDMLLFKDGAVSSGFCYKDKQVVAMPLEEYDKIEKIKFIVDTYFTTESMTKKEALDKINEVIVND